MLQMAPRYRIPPTRFPPVPYSSKRRGLSRADLQLIRSALVAGPPMLPTDVPDLSALITAVDELSAVDALIASAPIGLMPPLQRSESAA